MPATSRKSQSAKAFVDGQTMPFKMQLLKWIGNKQRIGHLIADTFPTDYRTYWEPFLGSGGVLGVFQPNRAVGSDGFLPLIGIWRQLHDEPALLVEWYRERWKRFQDAEERVDVYEEIKASYNAEPNPADLLFLSRSCYGGVVRFRLDGYMSTPCGSHNPISPESFEERVAIWHRRTQCVTFRHLDFREAFALTKPGDLVYCDPPYTDTQAILYGAQRFSLPDLLTCIADAKDRGVRVALSIDGTKKSGKKVIDLTIPAGLFETSADINVGRSMLRRFQLAGETLEHEVVTDRLLLTYAP